MIKIYYEEIWWRDMMKKYDGDIWWIDVMTRYDGEVWWRGMMARYDGEIRGKDVVCGVEKIQCLKTPCWWGVLYEIQWPQ